MGGGKEDKEIVKVSILTDLYLNSLCLLAGTH